MDDLRGIANLRRKSFHAVSVPPSVAADELKASKGVDTVVIVNPFSGGGSTERKWKIIENRLRRAFPKHDFHVVQTSKPRDATSLTRSALKRGAARIIAVGGDGTANEVANGFFFSPLSSSSGKLKAINPLAEMILIPAGTRNVIARSFSLPTEPLRSIDRLRSKRRKIREVDIICAALKGEDGRIKKSRVFLNAAELGVGALVIDRSRRIRKLVNSRTISTIVSLISTVPTYRSNDYQIDKHKVGSRQTLKNVTMCIIANGKFLGGGLVGAPRADPSDGLLDFVILKESGSLKLLAEFAGMKTGKYVMQENVVYTQEKLVSIKSFGRPVGVTVDGEIIGNLPATFTVMPRALKFG